MDIDYSRWLAAQEWIDALEREARVAYWCGKMDLHASLVRLYNDVFSWPTQDIDRDMMRVIGADGLIWWDDQDDDLEDDDER